MVEGVIADLHYYIPTLARRSRWVVSQITESLQVVLTVLGRFTTALVFKGTAIVSDT